MGLSDRYYMRDEYHPPRVATKLIIVLLVAFVVQSILSFYSNIPVIHHLGLTAAGLKAGKVWQLLTFQFLHSTPWPWHVLFNCLALYFFGRPVEERIGPTKFLILYLLCGIAGGLLQVATTALPNHEDIAVVGASAGICGMIAIFCSLNPMQELTTWIYFFPVTVRAIYFLTFLGLFSLFGTLIPMGAVAYAAHLGGILLGLAYVRWGNSWQGLWRWKPFHSRQRKRELVKAATIKTSRWPLAKMENPVDVPEDEFISKEVDPILDKISAHGIQSLTERERKILEAARAKMAKR
jgi:membrane associated rhomboid family serine protease